MRWFIILAAFSALALTFVAEADINGCTVDLNQLAIDTGGTFNGYYAEWDCTGNTGISNIIVTCRWFWDNHFQVIFEPAAAEYDNWVLFAGALRPAFIGANGWIYSSASEHLVGWKYWVKKILTDLIANGTIPDTCSPANLIAGGDVPGNVMVSANNPYYWYGYKPYSVTWNSPLPKLVWGCSGGGYLNTEATVYCGSGGKIFTGALNGTSPYFTTSSSTWGLLVIYDGTPDYTISANYPPKVVTDTLIQSPGTLRALKEIEPGTVEVGDPVEVTVRFDVPEATDVNVTDYVPADWAGSTLDVNVIIKDAVTDSVVSSGIQTVTLTSAGAYKTFTINIGSLTEHQYVVLKYTLTAPVVASPTTYTFPPAEITFEVPA